MVRKVWRFATMTPGTYVFQKSDKTDRYVEGGVFHASRRIAPIKLEFNNATLDAHTDDPHVAEVIMSHEWFRTRGNLGGIVWLVEGYPKQVGEVEAPTEPIVAPAPERREVGAALSAGARGTGSLAKGRQVRG